MMPYVLNPFDTCTEPFPATAPFHQTEIMVGIVAPIYEWPNRFNIIRQVQERVWERSDIASRLGLIVDYADAKHMGGEMMLVPVVCYRYNTPASY